jgi:cysteinyl-tRNA synthetase
VGVGSLRELVWALGLESLFEADQAADPDAERMMAEREEARAARDFERADGLRDELAQRGWQVRDTADGPRLVPIG